jgi:hypothetical protein
MRSRGAAAPNFADSRYKYVPRTFDTETAHSFSDINGVINYAGE